MDNFLTNKNVLITGANGLVGSHLTERLIAMGANIIATCRENDPRSYYNEKGFDKKVTEVIADIKDANRIFEIVTKYEIEYIFHVAAQAIVGTAYYNPTETFGTNIMGTVNILETARLYPRVKAVVVASSDKAYGKKCADATEDQPMAGDHPYDVSKSCADLIARTYYKTYGLPVAVSRFGNIYGPGDLNFNRIVPGMMEALINNETLELRSDGSFVRDYVYVKDVVDGYIVLAENIEKIKGEAFNFSTGYNFSVIDLIEKISKLLDKKLEYKILNNQKNEIPSQSLNYEKVKNVLGWESKHTFEEGIKETFAWYEKYLKK